MSIFRYRRATNIRLFQANFGSTRGYFSSTEKPLSQTGRPTERLKASASLPLREPVALKSEVATAPGTSPQRLQSIRNNASQPASQGLETADEPKTAALPVCAPVWVVALERNPGKTKEAKELFDSLPCFPEELPVAALNIAITGLIERKINAHGLRIAQEYEYQLKLYRENPCQMEGDIETDTIPFPLRDDFRQFRLYDHDPIERRDFEHPYFVILTRLQTRHWDRGTRHSQLLLNARHCETRRG